MGGDILAICESSEFVLVRVRSAVESNLISAAVLRCVASIILMGSNAVRDAKSIVFESTSCPGI